MDLEELLRRGGEKLVRSGREKRLESDHSVTVNGSRWYDHAAEQGGYALSFVRRHYGLNFSDAMKMLLGEDGQRPLPIAMGSQTILSGSVSKGKDNPSQTLQMMARPLMTPDELKSMPKGSFITMKTGMHPMKTKFQLFLKWGITFGKPLVLPEHSAREVKYAGREKLEMEIAQRYPRTPTQEELAQPDVQPHDQAARQARSRKPRTD